MRPANELSMPHDDDFDGLGAARGITINLPICAAFWAVVIGVILAVG